ncbi:MAG: copper chaperone PCu(A)C [Gammaproteobacteria bacterium]|nr:copper chaperone PCu(A)C [Gammaproteobacteria bacterium]
MSAKFNRCWVLSAVSYFIATVTMAEVKVDDAWIAANPPGSRVAAMYLTLTNTGDEPITVTSIKVDGVPRVMIHETLEENGQLKMRHRGSLRLDAGETITMSPGGLHVMLMGSGQFVVDQQVELLVHSDDQTSVGAIASVKRI